MHVTELLIVILGLFTAVVGIMWFLHISKNNNTNVSKIWPVMIMVIGLGTVAFPLGTSVDLVENTNESPSYMLKGEELFDASKPVKSGDYYNAGELYAKGVALWNPNKIGYDSADIAMDYFTRSIETYETAEAYTARGQLRVQLSQMKAALEDYDRAIALNDSFSKAYFNRGTVNYIMGNKGLACTDWQKASDLKLEIATQALHQNCN